jgi:hypothetical protein
MVKNIFDEALADMKSIRDLTESSVKQEILEKLTPQIRDLIEAQLLTDEEEGQENNKEKPEKKDGSKKTTKEKVINEFQTINTSFGIGYNTQDPDENGVVDEENFVQKKHTIHFSSLGNTKNLYENICAEIIKEVEEIKSSKIPSHQKIKNTLVKIQEVQKNLDSTKSINSHTKKIVESVLNDCFNQINNVGKITTFESKQSNARSSNEKYVIDLENMLEHSDLDPFDLLDADEYYETSSNVINTEDDDLMNENKKNWRNEMRRTNLNQLSENTILEIDDRDLMRALRESLAEAEDAEAKKPGMDDEGVDEDSMYEESMDEEGHDSMEEESLEEGWLEEEEMLDMSPSTETAPPPSLADEEPALPQGLDGLMSSGVLETLSSDELRQLASQASEMADALEGGEGGEGGEGMGMEGMGDLMPEPAMPSPAPLATMESRFNYYKKLYMEAKSGSKDEQKYLNILREVASKMTPNQKRRLIAEGSTNRTSNKSVSKTTDQAMRQKLAESNLLNSKLLYTNRLLQNENLTNRQKTKIIEKIDEAKSEREVRLVFESVEKLVSDNRTKNSYESRVIGSSSVPTRRSSATTLNENFEADRWAKLAGILR